MFQAAPKALQMSFRFHATEVTLADSAVVVMQAHPGDALDNYRHHAGFWLELQSADGETLYRRVMRNPMVHDVEIEPEPGSSDLRHRPVSKKSGRFLAAVPVMPDVESLVLFNSPQRHGGIDFETPPQAAQEIARFAYPQIGEDEDHG